MLRRHDNDRSPLPSACSKRVLAAADHDDVGHHVGLATD
jgi:hypothetical protein